MKSQSEIYQIDSQMDYQDLGGGVQRKVMGYDDKIMTVKVKFETGAVGATHTHPHSQSSYVARGKFELNIGGEVKVLEAGDGYYVAPNVPHGCVCLEDGILIDGFAPAREDFL